MGKRRNFNNQFRTLASPNMVFEDMSAPPEFGLPDRVEIVIEGGRVVRHSDYFDYPGLGESLTPVE